ncbi:carbohydrate ABC transporter permease [Petroclostridium xylanilyticum]|jgi:ABC-type sugar transport system permease subunit|uniref:carbohydrate ABC transporter permease n=1 Tax=Petroclostridium xylanilyticum TaxID=1792311 RepID=UPI000B9949FF|nr:sugar ABC transporter permease [Petroclostridium xylanilyticum]
MERAIESRSKFNKYFRIFKKNLFLFWTIFPAVSYIGIFFIIIAFFLLKLSLTKFTGGQEVMVPTLSNYMNIINSAEFMDALIRTFIFVLITTPLQLVSGLLFAMLINRQFKGRGIIRSIFLLPLAIPTIVTTATLLLLFSKGGHATSLLMGEYSWFPQVLNKEISFINNEFTAIGISIFGKVWRDTPISMLILLAGLQSIDNDQYEAARTMGSGSVKNFFYITLPLLVPAISSVLVLRSIEAWKEFIFPYILAPSFPVLGVLIEKYYVQLMDPGTAAVIGIILIVIILIGSVILNWLLEQVRKYLVKV